MPKKNKSKKKVSKKPKVKNVKCDHCELLFETKWKMQRHANRTHLNIEKHYCPECPEIIDNVHDFYVHMRREHKLGHTCGVCSMTFPLQKMRAIHEKEVHNLVRSQPKSKEDEKKAAVLAVPPINPLTILPPIPGMPVPNGFVPPIPPLPMMPPISGFPTLPVIPPPFNVLPGMPPFIPPNPFASQPALNDQALSSDLFAQYAQPSSSFGQQPTAVTKTVPSSYNTVPSNQPKKPRVSRFDQVAPPSSYDKLADLYKPASYESQTEHAPTFGPPTAAPYYPDRESASYPRQGTKSLAPPSNPYEFERQDRLYSYEAKAPPSLSPPRSSRRYNPY